jgi:hypothetical protein
MRRHALLLAAAAACGEEDAPGAADAGSADAAPPVKPACNPLIGDDCVTPFPSSFYLEPAATRTGVAVAIGDDVLPRSAAGVVIRPDRLNGKDGFSPSTPFLVYFAGGVDVAGLPTLDDLGASTAPTSTIQIIPWDGGPRVPLFAEVDANAGVGQRQGLIIRPQERLRPATRYIVALVGLRDAAGAPLAPAPFRALRDRAALTPELAWFRPAYEELFARLEDAGVPRASLSLAWDVTTASVETLTGHLLAMRDEALARVDDGTLGYRVVSSRDTPGETHRLREVKVRAQAPWFLESDAPEALMRFGADGLPRADGVAEFDVTIEVPRCAETATRPLPFVVFGHGLFGTAAETLASPRLHRAANDLCMILVGTDWLGLTTPDLAVIAGTVLPDLNKVYIITDRLQQAHVNAQVMTRLFRARIKDDPALAVTGRPISDGAEVYYFGISNGGVQGGTFMALSPDVERGVLNVPGCQWSLMIYRSTQFSPLYPLLNAILPDPLDRQLLVAASQSEWDHSDPASFAPHLIRDPLPGVRPKRVILQEAIGDSQVPNMATRVLARAIGLQGFGLVEPVYGIEEAQGPLDSAYTQWDTHRTPLPPAENVPPPVDNGAHGAIQGLPALNQQLRLFFRPDGLAVNTCEGPCDFP